MQNNLIETVHELCRLISVRVTKTTLRTQLLKLPDNKTLYTISELLDKFHVLNETYAVEPSELENDHCPFISTIVDENKFLQFVVVKEISPEHVVLYNENFSNAKVERAKFNKISLGNCLWAEKMDKSGEHQYKSKRFKEIFDILNLPILFTLLSLIILSLYFRHIQINNQLYRILTIKIIGIATTILLTLKIIKPENSFIKQLCTPIKKFSCDSVTSGPASKLLGIISWAELGLFYYLSTTVVLIITGFNHNILVWAAWASCFSLLFVPYSIIYQAFIVKKICPLCCLVLFCLVTEFFNNYNNLIFPIPSLTYYQVYWLTLIPLITTTFGIYLQQSTQKIFQYAVLENEISRFKYNSDIFFTILKNEPYFGLPEASNSIILGNSKSKNIITLITNPTCAPCARVHAILKDLIKTGDVQIRIILTGPPSTKIIIKHLLALEKNQAKDIQSAIDGWYAQEKKNYESWANKFPVAYDNDEFDGVLINHQEWLNRISYEGTPFITINGYQFPKSYLPEDLQYLFSA